MHTRHLDIEGAESTEEQISSLHLEISGMIDRISKTLPEILLKNPNAHELITSTIKKIQEEKGKIRPLSSKEEDLVTLQNLETRTKGLSAFVRLLETQEVPDSGRKNSEIATWKEIIELIQNLYDQSRLHGYGSAHKFFEYKEKAQDILRDVFRASEEYLKTDQFQSRVKLFQNEYFLYEQNYNDSFLNDIYAPKKRDVFIELEKSALVNGLVDLEVKINNTLVAEAHQQEIEAMNKSVIQFSSELANFESFGDPQVIEKRKEFLVKYDGLISDITAAYEAEMNR